MANALYPFGKQGFLDGSINWSSNDTRAMLVKTAQAYNTAHEFVSDLTGANIVQRMTATLTSKTVTSGVAGAANPTLTAVPTGSTCNVVVYQFNASDSAARLIAFYDTGTGLPVTTNGGDITIQWNASGLFAI